MNEQKKINIILMSPLPPPSGGIAQWTVRYLKAGENYFHFVHVNEAVDAKRKIFGDKSKRHLLLEYKRCLRIWKDLKNALKDNNDAIVHCCIPSIATSMLREYFSLKIAKKYQAKFVIHFRSTVPYCATSGLSKLLLKKFAKKADGFILLNEESLNYIKEFHPNGQLEVIPNFISVDELKLKETSQEMKNFIYCGGVEKDKGCDDIILYAKNYPNYHFSFIGNPSQDILEMAKGLKNVTFYGEQNKEFVYDKLKQSDVFLFLSRYKNEGFSNSMIEAMGMGLPCIATNWASAKMQIGKYSDPLLIQNHDEEGFKKAIDFLSDYSHRLEVAQFNFEHVKNEYSEHVIIEKYYQFFKNLAL